MSDRQMEETALRLERLIPSPPEVLFAFWTEPAKLLTWWGPDGYETSVHSLDTQPGGRWRISLHRAGTGVRAVSGVYRIVEPPRRLAFTWAWEDESGTQGPETEVTVTFEATTGGTRLVLMQQRFESKQACDNHMVGWSSSFDRLTKAAG